MLWAGQHTVLEINQLNESVPNQPIDSPEDCEMLPTFSVISDELIRSDYSCVDMEFESGLLPCAKDIDGNWIGFLEETESRNLRKVTLEQTPELRFPLVALNHVVLRSRTPEKQAEFYQSLFGQEPQVDTTKICIGSSTYLHCLGGNPKRQEPKDREEVQRVFIPRVYEFTSFVDRAGKAEARLINEITFDGGNLNYYLDPVGQLFGFQERKPFDPSVATTQAIEDRLAREVFSRGQDEEILIGESVAV